MVVAAGVSLNACGNHGADEFGDDWRMPTLIPSSTATQTESYIRTWLAYIHMHPTDADCFIDMIEAAPYWKTEPPSAVPPQVADEFAEACGIDYTELYTVSYVD